jgi:hypothetical protein
MMASKKFPRWKITRLRLNEEVIGKCSSTFHIYYVNRYIEFGTHFKGGCLGGKGF